MVKNLQILIADDHPIFRRGLKDFIIDEFPNVAFTEVASAEQVLQVLQKKKWDVLLLDINMPGRSGLEILADVKKACPRLPVLMLSAATEQQYGLRVLKAGASGYITKLRAPEEIVAAVKQVITGGLYVSPAMGLKLASHVSGNPTRDLHDKLSDREMEILLRIGAGAGTKEIAADLSLSPTTVSTYRARMRDKLGVKTTAELIRYTIDNNLSEP